PERKYGGDSEAGLALPLGHRRRAGLREWEPHSPAQRVAFLVIAFRLLLAVRPAPRTLFPGPIRVLMRLSQPPLSLLAAKFDGNGGPFGFGHRSATLNFALRARGFAASSMVDAVTGFLVRALRRSSSRKATLTRRSSNEWKLMIATRPPGLRRSGI